MESAEAVPDQGTGNPPESVSIGDAKSERQAQRIYKKAKAWKDAQNLPEYHGAKDKRVAFMQKKGSDGKYQRVSSIAQCGLQSLVYTTPSTLLLENPTREDFLDEGISVYLLCPQVHNKI